MTCRDTTKGAVDALARASSGEDLWNVFKTVAATYGYEHVLAARAGDEATSLVYSNVPGEILRTLDRGGLAGGMPVEHILASPRPFLASEAPLPMSDGQRRLLDHAKEVLGVSEILLLPLHDQGIAEGYVALGGREPVTTPIIRSSLHVLAHLAFQGMAGCKTRKGPNLSPRESECLRLAAQGNTDVEIGRLLTISPRTTRFHIENAKKKLGVTTRTQAVAEALRLNAFAA